jgi:hypothetical protein
VFDRNDIEKYEFENVPLNRDIYLMEKKFIVEYERNIVRFLEGNGEFKNVGSIAYAAARAVDQNSIELSWYPNIYDRFHEVRIFLPRADFVACVGSWNIDEKPRIFVNDRWLAEVHARTYSAFAMVDAIGVKTAIQTGTLTRSLLLKLRKEIDDIARHFSNVAFFSFADAVILKYNWSYRATKELSYDYDPEVLIRLLEKINQAYKNTIGLETYAVLAQGANEYYDDDLLHISGNHISFNSLGLPFAQIHKMDETIRNNLRAKLHPQSEVYMDDQFLRSLRLKHDFNKRELNSAPYSIPMAIDTGNYVMASRAELLSNLDPEISVLRKR